MYNGLQGGLGGGPYGSQSALARLCKLSLSHWNTNGTKKSSQPFEEVRITETQDRQSLIHQLSTILEQHQCLNLFGQTSASGTNLLTGTHTNGIKNTKATRQKLHFVTNLSYVTYLKFFFCTLLFHERFYKLMMHILIAQIKVCSLQDKKGEI